MEFTIKTYKTINGKCPFRQQLCDLSDMKARVAIELRIDRLEMGNFGNSKSLGGRLYELKINVGQGYRVYEIKKCLKK